MRVEEHIPLAPHTTFHIGGPARFFVRVSTIDELIEALSYAHSQHIPFLILGGGSNMLISDEGFAGLVIKIELKGISVKGDMYIAQAGEVWDDLTLRACTEGLWGIENLSGIPGTVGAAPIQNIGAYGVELKDSLAWVEAIDTKNNTLVRLTPHECDFGYRTSLFKKNLNRYVIVRVALALSSSGTPKLSYKDLAQAAQTQSLRDPRTIREAVLSIRSKKFPDLAVAGTAGSFFLNPIVSSQKAEELLKLYPGLPAFSAQGGMKISLAWLLDHALHVKDLSVGSARVFERQPLVIVAEKNAHAGDVFALQEKISSLVLEMFGISLQPEVRIV